MTNYYAVLGVSESATDQEIRAAYNRLLQESLTDQERFTAVKEAYEVLGNPASRQTYDRDRMTPPGPGALQPATSQAAAPAAETETAAPAPTPPVAEPSPARTAVPDATVLMGNVDRTRTAPLRKPAGADATVAMLPTQCAVCGHLNPPGETYCAECGFLLSSSAEKGAFLPSEEDMKSWPHLEDEAGQLYVLKPGTNIVGRESADIRIADKTVSRHHATIVFHEERGLFSVEDKGSTNGTAVNGAVLPSGVPHPIHSGDQVRFGSFVMNLVANETRAFEPTRVLGGEEDPEDEYNEADEPSLIELGDAATSTSLAQLTLAQGFGPREISIERGVTTVGRLPDNTLCLKHDRYVSGHHARIVAEDDVFRLLDVGSTNGTMLNGLRLTTNEAITINEGDEVTFGGTSYQFHVLKAPLPAGQKEAENIERTDLPEAAASGEQ